MTKGGRIRSVGVGGAPVSGDLLAFLKKYQSQDLISFPTRRLFPGYVSEGYGITEVGSIYIDGVISTGVAVKLVDWEDYRCTDLPYPRGEICVKTEMMFSNYYGDDSTTYGWLSGDYSFMCRNEKMIDGWFHTGDIGVLVDNGYQKRVVLLDRKKNLFKTSQGEFISYLHTRNSSANLQSRKTGRSVCTEPRD